MKTSTSPENNKGGRLVESPAMYRFQAFRGIPVDDWRAAAM